MTGKRSREAILEFQDYQARKGLLSKGTAGARKAALGKVLGILGAEEAEDVTKLDLDELMMRFSNLEGKGYTPGSLTTYKSRIRAAIDDFESYVTNPLGFRPSVNRRERNSTRTEKKPSRASAPEAAEPAPARPSSPGFDAPDILPIPLRSDLVVRIQGLPFDMTQAEAKKIANVILAMAMT